MPKRQAALSVLFNPKLLELYLVNKKMPNKHVWSCIIFRENNLHSLGMEVREEVGKRFRSYIYEGSFEALTASNYW